MLAKLNKSWFFGIIIVFIVLLFLFLNHKGKFFVHDEMTIIKHTDEEKNIDNIDEVSNKEEEQLNFIVDVKGEVVNPGVYEVEIDARTHHVIDLAGGFTKKANEESVNLAQKVHDEMVVLVPAIGAKNDQSLEESSSINKIRINFATQEEIEKLSGIGPAKAKTIIEYRDEHGQFTSVDDLLNISGIGEKTLDNIRNDIQIP